MARVRQDLTETLEELKIALSELQSVGEQVTSVAVGVATCSLSVTASRVSKTAKKAKTEATKVLKTVEVAEAAAARATAMVSVAVKAQLAAKAKAAEATAAAQAAESATEAAETAAAVAAAATALTVGTESLPPMNQRGSHGKKDHGGSGRAKQVSEKRARSGSSVSGGTTVNRSRVAVALKPPAQANKKKHGGPAPSASYADTKSGVPAKRARIGKGCVPTNTQASTGQEISQADAQAMKKKLQGLLGKASSSGLDSEGYNIKTGFNKQGVDRQGHHFFDAGDPGVGNAEEDADGGEEFDKDDFDNKDIDKDICYGNLDKDDEDAPLAAFRESVAKVDPFEAASVKDVRDWKVSLLALRADRKICPNPNPNRPNVTTVMSGKKAKKTSLGTVVAAIPPLVIGCSMSTAKRWRDQLEAVDVCQDTTCCEETDLMVDALKKHPIGATAIARTCEVAVPKKKKEN